MCQLLALGIALFAITPVFSKTITVKNIDELNAANSTAQPGDTVVLLNGIWKDVLIKLNCSGSAQKPIVFKAQAPGRVVISGISQLKLGGSYIVVDGLLFANGHSPSSAVIEYRISSKELANHCRVTNTVINDFNKPKRMDEDQWVSFYGKNNRLDHSSFYNKKNMGVLLAVILDDDRSRENFHSIDHNYFGVRPPLGSNGGEIIRVGVSQHCEFNSNTQIKENFFEYCDGETEIVSIKSGGNLVSKNVFKQCQGSVVLRHGNDNTVTNNIFLGYGKPATGGVRIINRGQWVINNFFYQCRGESFKAPLVIMNGIPNSPAHRYVQVTDAVVMNNSFVDCTPVSFGEGSDPERTLPPDNVLFAKNIFYNSKDSLVFNAWDDISGIHFSENKVSRDYSQALPGGFQQASFATTKNNLLVIPTAGRGTGRIGLDSLMQMGKERLPVMTPAPGFTDVQLIKDLETNAYTQCGAKWFRLATPPIHAVLKSCRTSSEVYTALANPYPSLKIKLTGSSYSFDKPMLINKKIEFTSDKKKSIEFKTSQALDALFLIQNKGDLNLNNLDLASASLLVNSFVASDTSGNAEHYNLKMRRITFKDLHSCQAVFRARKSSFADSIVIENCVFMNPGSVILMADEKDDKGYYNAEKVRVVSNHFINGNGVLLDIYRGGNDESTLGPDLVFANNKISNYKLNEGNALLKITGVQKTRITGNTFRNAAAGKTLIRYKDIVRARHEFSKNNLLSSGTINKNQYVTDHGNSVH